MGVESRRPALEKSLKMQVKLPGKVKDKPFANTLVKDNTQRLPCGISFSPPPWRDIYNYMRCLRIEAVHLLPTWLLLRNGSSAAFSVPSGCSLLQELSSRYRGVSLLWPAFLLLLSYSVSLFLYSGDTLHLCVFCVEIVKSLGERRSMFYFFFILSFPSVL